MFFSQRTSMKKCINPYFVLLLCTFIYHIKTTNSFVIPSEDGSPDRLQACHIPTGRASFCVPLSRCNQLTKLVTSLKLPLSVDVAKYIKDSFTCPNTDTVCCPFASIVNPTPKDSPADLGIRDKGM